jgi:hypothetical protein
MWSHLVTWSERMWLDVKLPRCKLEQLQKAKSAKDLAGESEAAVTMPKSPMIRDSEGETGRGWQTFPSPMYSSSN